MTLKRNETFDQPGDLKRLHDEILNNLSMDDLRILALQKAVPTTKTLAKGRMRVDEISDEPRLYIRALNGDIYEFTGTKL